MGSDRRRRRQPNPPPGADERPALLERRLGRRRLLALAGSGGAAAVLAACKSGGNAEPNQSPAPADSPTAAATASSEPTVGRPGWGDTTHGNDAEPNHGIVFPADRVNQMTFVVTPEKWTAMLANMTELFGARGPSRGGFGPAASPEGGFLPEGEEPGDQPDDGPPADQPGGGPRAFPAENPDWFPATVRFQDRTWRNVGLRFKGNSSLRGAWETGSDRLPFKLDFDQFEDDVPEILNQRFYGFKQLSLANNFGDLTGMRETVAYDIFERAGLVAAHTAPYEILLDRGEGPFSLGLYTLVEVIDDTVIERSFEDDGGSLFKGEGAAASLGAETFAAIPGSFPIDAGEEDWGPIEELFNILHSEQRTTDPAGWRTELEAIFDVDVFLEWLGISAAILHWDTYGQMTHNYYLYDDPATGRLTWISWDHNFVLAASGGGPQRRPGFGRGVSLDQANVTAEWPLIRHLVDDPVFRGRYVEHLRETAASVFVADEMDATYERLRSLIEPYVPDAEKQTFKSAVDALALTTRVRVAALNTFLETA